MATRVLLVEDHPVVLRGLRALIEDEDDLAVVAQAATTAQAIAAARACEPDVVVVPMRLGGTFRGMGLCRSLKSTGPARVVVFTSFTRTIDLRVALLAGADAVLGKTADTESVVRVLRRVAAGGPPLVLAPGAVTPVPHVRSGIVEELTARELEILELVAEGLANHEIAGRLYIEVTTVKTHVRSILRKLGAGSRRDLLRGPGATSPPGDRLTNRVKNCRQRGAGDQRARPE